jgi:hypothetical protein
VTYIVQKFLNYDLGKMNEFASQGYVMQPQTDLKRSYVLLIPDTRYHSTFRSKQTHWDDADGSMPNPTIKILNIGTVNPTSPIAMHVHCLVGYGRFEDIRPLMQYCSRCDRVNEISLLVCSTDSHPGHCRKKVLHNLSLC